MFGDRNCVLEEDFRKIQTGPTFLRRRLCDKFQKEEDCLKLKMNQSNGPH